MSDAASRIDFLKHKYFWVGTFIKPKSEFEEHHAKLIPVRDLDDYLDPPSHTDYEWFLMRCEKKVTCFPELEDGVIA